MQAQLGASIGAKANCHDAAPFLQDQKGTTFHEDIPYFAKVEPVFGKMGARNLERSILGFSGEPRFKDLI